MLRSKFPVRMAPAGISPRQAALSTLILLASSSVVLLAGCGAAGSNLGGSSTTSLAVQGRVFGGAQPVKGSTVKLYAAATSGYAGASTLLTTTTTDNAGNFNITGTYTCPANSQVYIAATGGDPGTGASNANLALAAGLDTCSGSLSPSLFINLNEVTTIATAYALSAFSTDLTHVGTSSTNVAGLANAMATINNLVDISTGKARTITPAYAGNTVAGTNTSTVPTASINTLADILSSCVNSSGGVAGDASGCGNLFSAVTSPAPTDTYQAALRIAQNPGQNVAAIYNTLPPNAGAPFQPTVASQPNDFTLVVLFIGGGLGETGASNRAQVTDLKIDAAGNIWLPSTHNSRIIKLDNLGAPLSPSTTPTTVGGYSGNGIVNPGQLAVDLEGNPWVTLSSGGGAALLSNGTSYPGSPFIYPSTPSAQGITIDGLDNVWIPSTSNSTVTKLDHTGAFVAALTSTLSSPGGGIGVDPAENIYVLNGNATITEFSNAGALLGNGNPGTNVNTPNPHMALDGRGNEWIPQAGVSQTILEAMGVATGTSNGPIYAPASVFQPSSLAIDGLGNVWALNSGGLPPTGPRVAPNVTELSNSGATITPPGTGYLLANPSNDSPIGVGIDASGNVWIANQNSATNVIGASNVQEFIGAGAPTVTPVSLAVKNNTLSVRP